MTEARPKIPTVQAYPHTVKDIDLFWSKVRKGPSCWEWTAALYENGYGCFTLKRAVVRAHRFIWHVTNGQIIPDGMMVMHSCDNRKCVNPGHLILGTGLDNANDRDRKKRHIYGEKSPHAKVDENLVRIIRADQRGLVTMAREIGVSRTLIQRIRQRKAWAHVE